MAESGECIFKKTRGLSCQQGETKTKVLAIWELRQENYKLALLLKISGIKKSVYYYHAKRLNEYDKDAELKQEISDLYHHHKGRYGYRRITLELRNRGRVFNHKKIRRLMAEMKLVSKIHVIKYNSYKGTV